MREPVFFIFRWATNFALACLAIAASVKPEDAMSNLSGWAKVLHLPAPAWLQSSASDHIIFWGAISGVVALWIGPKVWRRRHLPVYQQPHKQAAQTQAEIMAKLANDPELSEALDASIREGLKSVDIAVEESIRPSIKLKFLRWRGFYEFFAKPPFRFYWAKRRLEFIDAWRWFFHEHNKVIIPDLGDERKRRKAQITAALIFVTNQGPNEIFDLCLRPDDLRMEIEALKQAPSSAPLSTRHS
jgi:hypothetical protein